MENLKEKNKEFIFLYLVNYGKVKEKWKEKKSIKNFKIIICIILTPCLVSKRHICKTCNSYTQKELLNHIQSCDRDKMQLP